LGEQRFERPQTHPPGEAIQVRQMRRCKIDGLVRGVVAGRSRRDPEDEESAKRIALSRSRKNIKRLSKLNFFIRVKVLERRLNNKQRRRKKLEPLGHKKRSLEERCGEGDQV